MQVRIGDATRDEAEKAVQVALTMPQNIELNTKSMKEKVLRDSCYEGESLAYLLKSIKRQIVLARQLDRALPDKIWLKQQFSIGVNDVTRVLERMPPIVVMGSSSRQPLNVNGRHSKPPPVQLQAILLASDCYPRWLIKHLPSMASSKKVPLIFVKDKKGGSLRLGELVKLRTAIAIGVKAKGNAINQFFEEILYVHKNTCRRDLTEVN